MVNMDTPHHTYSQVFENGEDLTKVVSTHIDHSFRCVKYLKDGELHRIGEPAYVEYYRGGSLYTESWCQNGIAFREKGPTDIIYHESGNIANEIYLKDGNVHRDDGPAVIEYDDETGLVKSVEYHKNGVEIVNEEVIRMLEEFPIGSAEWQFTWDMI